MKLFALIIALLIVTILAGVGAFAALTSGMALCVIPIGVGGGYMQHELCRMIACVVE